MAMIDSYLDKETVRLLCQSFGGRRISIPAVKSGQAWERLKDALGDDRAGSVVRFFANELLAIPKAPDETTKETIKALHQAGTPVSEISKMSFLRRYGERQIHRICAADKAA